MTTNHHPSLRTNNHQPVIGVVVAVWSPDSLSGAARTIHEQLITTTVETIRELGARPVVIDSADRDQQASGTQWHAAVDAVVYLGGADVHPSLYSDVSEALHFPDVDIDADRFCINSLQQAVTEDLPALGICRGAQLLNVALGGTLIAHIDGHRSELADGSTGFVDETLQLEPSSKIAEILGRPVVKVRGSHHQTVDAVGDGLTVTARAVDGTIEGVEHQEKSWVVGLQWHPEEAHANVEDRRRIFAALIAQVR